ncbi:MAG: LPXTG cell wall anchor domain-containing protein [Acetobacteraceae bacterium]|nr:LPXTG cell wall anchor domain-containing protein [Acetobacteraceae bacterium]
MTMNEVVIWIVWLGLVALIIGLGGIWLSRRL